MVCPDLRAGFFSILDGKLLLHASFCRAPTGAQGLERAQTVLCWHRDGADGVRGPCPLLQGEDGRRLAYGRQRITMRHRCLFLWDWNGRRGQLMYFLQRVVTTTTPHDRQGAGRIGSYSPTGQVPAVLASVGNRKLEAPGQNAVM